MCLFHTLDCSAHNASELRRFLTRPSREVIAAGLIRCKWHEAVTRSYGNAQHRSKFQDPDAVCPYVVVRHDEVPLPEDVVKDIVEAVYLECVPDRGCPDCEATISAKEMLGPIPTREEKREYLLISDWAGSSAIAKPRHTSQVGVAQAGRIAGQEASEAWDVKRKNQDGKDETQKVRDDGEEESGDDASSDDIHIVEPRQVKRVRLGTTQQNDIQDDSRSVSPAAATGRPNSPSIGKKVPPTSRQREASSSPALGSTPIGKGSRFNLSDAALDRLTQGTRSSRQWSQVSGMTNLLQSQKEDVFFATAPHLSIRTQTARIPEQKGGTSKSQQESKEKEVRPMSPQALNSSNRHCIDLTRTSTVESSKSQMELAEAPTSSQEKERIIREHVQDAFNHLDSAATQPKDAPAQGGENQGDGQFGPEVLRAVRDGSFKTAVEEVSRLHWDLDDAPASSSKACSGRKGKGDMLANSVRILRAEKATFVDRIAGLLEEKAASMEREAALLRRVAELERVVQANGSGKEKGTISPSPSPQAP